MLNVAILYGPKYGNHYKTKEYIKKDILASNIHIHNLNIDVDIDVNNVIIYYKPDSNFDYQIEFYVRLYDKKSPIFLQQTFYFNKHKINIIDNKLVIDLDDSNIKFNDIQLISKLTYTLILSPNIVKKIHKNIFTI